MPKIAYEKCVNECKNWETKFNELYLRYMNLSATTAIESQSSELELLRQENLQLKALLREEQSRRLQSMPVVEAKFNQLLNQQREATIRECTLLMQRFRLENKQPHRF